MNNVDEQIKELKALAAEHGYKIRYRNHPTASGDFTIFIYTPVRKNMYTIGFDGYWGAKKESPCNFDNCVKQAKHFIERFSTDEEFRNKYKPC